MGAFHNRYKLLPKALPSCLERDKEIILQSLKIMNNWLSGQDYSEAFDRQ